MVFRGLNDLTIIIPTVSRPLFVLRQFEYWGATDAKVVILDGAASPIAIPAELERDNVRYVHSGNRFNERLATAGQFVSTKFCVLLTDDEFYLPSGLLAAIKRLEADSSIIGCVGRCLFFFVDQGRFLLSNAYREWRPFPTDKTSLMDRLDADLPPNKTHKAQFAVMRSQAWIEMFERSYSTFFSSGYTYERLLNLTRTVLGRTEMLEEVMWMRSMENPPISSANVPRRGTGEFVVWATSAEFATEIAQYREIARGILRSGGLGESECRELEERFFVGGVLRQSNKQAKNAKSLSRRLEKFVLANSPRQLRLWAKRHLPNRVLKFTGWQGHEIDKMCAILEDLGTRFDYRELERVSELSLELDKRRRNA